MLTVSVHSQPGQADSLPGVVTLFPDPAVSPLAVAAAPGPQGRGRGEDVPNTLTPHTHSRYYTKSASTAGQGLDGRESLRRWRHARRRFLWLAASRERVRKCGRVRLDGDPVIKVRDGVAHYSGLMSCGDVWACPPCSAKIRNTRAAEISDAAARWMAAGHGLYMVTLTVPHDVGQPLGKLWRSLTMAMQAVRGGRGYQQVKADLGIAATATAKEITHGVNGWHPHLHLLVFTEAQESADGWYGLLMYMRGAWAREVVKAGLGEPDPLYGVRVDICYSGADAGLYLAKCQDGRSVGNELARGDLKSAGEGHRTPFEILADLERFGLVSDRDLWAEYEQVMRGKRALVWSRGYREILGMDVEQTDEEIAAAEVGGQSVATLAGETWPGVLAAKRILLPWSDTPVPVYTALLEAAERGGLAVVNGVLAAAGVPLAIVPACRGDTDVGADEAVA